MAVSPLPGAVTPRRNPRVICLVLLAGAGSVACLIGAAVPLSPDAPVLLTLVAGLLAGLTAIALWLGGDRLPAAGFQVVVAAGTGLVSAIDATAATGAGVVLTSFGYLCLALYAAQFFPRPALYAHLVLIMVGFGSALLINGTPGGLKVWVFVGSVVWGTALMLASLVEQLRQQAVTDPLTGLLNREGFALMAARELAMAQRSGMPFSIALIDLDDFKKVNDQRGHAEGDRVLAAVTRVWAGRLRGYDVLARQGGDEFVILMPQTDEVAATATMTRLKADPTPITWSVGLAVWQAGETIEACLARADRNLYGSKTSRSSQSSPTG